jgi:hypothetical protein
VTLTSSKGRPALRSLAAALAWTLCAVARAQDLNFAAIGPDDRHLLRAGVGVEDALVVSGGYGHVVSLRGRALVLAGDLDVVPVHAADWRVRAGAAAPLLSRGRWTAGGEVRGVVRHAGNQVNTMTNAGLESALTGGFYDRRWHVAVEAGVDWAAATYIHHSERYRRLVYDGARDGWYASPGTTLVYGVAGGWSFRGFDVVARVGQRRDLELRTWLLPLYATLGVNVRLGRDRR